MQVLGSVQLVPSTVTVNGSRSEDEYALPKMKPTRVGWHWAMVTRNPVFKPAAVLLAEAELPRLLYLVAKSLSKIKSGELAAG